MDFVSTDIAMETITKWRGHRPQRFASFFPDGTNPQALDLLFHMLKWHPDDRITVEDALAHPYLKDFHGQMAEPTCSKMFDFTFEKATGEEMSEEEVTQRHTILYTYLHIHQLLLQLLLLS